MTQDRKGGNSSIEKKKLLNKRVVLNTFYSSNILADEWIPWLEFDKHPEHTAQITSSLIYS